MKKYIFILLLPLLAVALCGCDDEENTSDVNLNLFAGRWELISRNHPDYGCIYDFEQSPEDTDRPAGQYHGSLITYYLTATGKPLYNQAFSWDITETGASAQVLNLTLIGDLDSYESSSEILHYKIVRLTTSHLWLQTIDSPQPETFTFRRRTDLSEI